VARKLIEAALPLDAINAACEADKDRKTGTIRNLHKWFAPMPSVAWRALLFASLVDDPGDEEGRRELRELVEALVATGALPPAEDVLERARRLIADSNPDGLPVVADPFCGGGSTIVEAQHLGLPTQASDLNPVPVLITRLLTELLPMVANHDPVATSSPTLARDTSPFASFTSDVRRYSTLVRRRAEQQIGSLFPRADADTVMLAWLWARTARCPNPACGIATPLVTSWWLSKRKGSRVWIQPRVRSGHVDFEIASGAGEAPAPTKVGRGANFICVACGSALKEDYVQSEGRAGRLGLRLTAGAGQRGKERVFLPASELASIPAVTPEDPPSLPLPNIPRWFSPPLFGFQRQEDLYTPRQIATLETFARLVREVADDMRADGADDAYATAVATFLGLCVGKLAQASSVLARWRTRDGTSKVEPGFGRHDIPSSWDFAEANPFGGSVGDWDQIVKTALRAVPFAAANQPSRTLTHDARTVATILPATGAMVATDPPYFAHIGYADLSDFFYVWLRRALRDEHTDLFSTIAAPRGGELIALTNRHDGDADAAHRYFVEGFTETFANLRRAQREDLPMLVVYAHREQEADEGRGGWEAMLSALINAEYEIVGTLPLRATGPDRMIGQGANALATYVVMVCRPRAHNAPRLTRRELDRVMRKELRGAVSELQQASVAAVDLNQAVLGPGMQIYSRYSAVLETDDSKVTVAEALKLILRTLAEVLHEQEGDLDADSRWAAAWYEDHGFDSAGYGQADAHARAKGISVDSLVTAGIVRSGAGRVQLLTRAELPDAWDPGADARRTAWEAVQHLCKALEGGGEASAAEILARLGTLRDPTRELAYRLFQVAEGRGDAAEALNYNSLISSWPEIVRLAEDRINIPDPAALF
jgi:putative DNA methylase